MKRLRYKKCQNNVAFKEGKTKKCKIVQTTAPRLLRGSMTKPHSQVAWSSDIKISFRTRLLQIRCAAVAIHIDLAEERPCPSILWMKECTRAGKIPRAVVQFWVVIKSYWTVLVLFQTTWTYQFSAHEMCQGPSPCENEDYEANSLVG